MSNKKPMQSCNMGEYMKIEDFKKMEARGKMMSIDETKGNTSLEVECYYNPRDGKTYLVDMQSMRYRELLSHNSYGTWVIDSVSITDTFIKTATSVLKNTSQVVGDTLIPVKVTIDKASSQAKIFFDKTGVAGAVNTVSDTVGGTS